MNVFITGATGFIGRSVVRQLLEHHHHATLLLLPGEYSPFKADVRIVRGDITQAESLENLMADQEAVIHMAGTSGYRCWRDCRAINRRGTHNVVNEAVRSRVRRFIHVSSVSVYGRLSRVTLTEDYPYRKIGDPFGDTKIDAEQIIRRAAAKHKLELTIIRPTMVYGKDDNRFIPFLIRNLKKRDCCMIGSGNHSVDLIHISDVSDMIMRVLEDRHAIGSIYNLTHRENPTWKEMLEVIVRELNTAMPRRKIPYPLAIALAGFMEAASKFTGRPPRMTRHMVRSIGRQYHYSTERAEKDLGFVARVDPIDGMRDSVKNVVPAI